MFTQIGAVIGIPEDQARMICGFILTIPLGFIYKQLNCKIIYIKAPKIRLIVGLIFGVLLSLMVYREQIINVIIQSIIVYELSKRIHQGKLKAKMVFYETIIYVSLHHIHRQYTDYGGWKLDITTILMMNTIKWTSFAYCVEDGRSQDLTKEQEQRKITVMPSYLNYFGYIFFFGGCLAGPSFDFYDYDIFINLKDVYSAIPNTVMETLRKFRNAILFSFCIVVLYPYWSLESVLSEEFAEANFFYKLLWFNITITLHRTKYISGWYFAESGIAAAGFTYNGKVNSIDQWERIRSIDPKVDLTTNPQEKLKCWNISTQKWLKSYVYMRFYSNKELEASASKKTNANLMTFLVSALWHGFYPAYYLSFFQWGVIDQLNKYFYKVGQNTNYMKILDMNFATKLVKFIVANSLFNCFGIGFQLLNIKDNLKFYSSFGYAFNIAPLIVFAFFLITGFGQRKRKQQ